jgi:LemA protein
MKTIAFDAQPSRIALFFFTLVFVAVAFSGCGYNSIQGLDEEVTGAWSEVQNQFQRRYDLIPNLVSTVKGYAAHEADTLKAVTEARSRVGQVNVTPDMLSDPKAFQNYQAAQSKLGGALSRLLVVAERYPDLKASANFLNLQSQLEGTENRIAVARRRYIEAVKQFNKKVRYFPSNLTAKYILKMEVKQNFALENEAVKEVPKVEF